MRPRIPGDGIGGDLRTASMLPDYGFGSMVFPGDTTNPMIFKYINIINNLMFFDGALALSVGAHDPAAASKLRGPDRPAAELAGLRLDTAIYVTHFKPREVEIIM